MRKLAERAAKIAAWRVAKVAVKRLMPWWWVWPAISVSRRVVPRVARRVQARRSR